MPCEKCRIHLRQFLRENVFIKFHVPVKGSQPVVRDHIRTELFQLHNRVNQNAGKPMFTMDEYKAVYGNLTRQETVIEAKKIMEELESSFCQFDYIKKKPLDYNSWKGSFTLLVAMLS